VDSPVPQCIASYFQKQYQHNNIENFQIISIMDSTVDIVHLIESNPITKLSGSYQSKLLTKIKNKFTDTEQQMFVASFYCYLQYNSSNDFVVELDNVWEWLGFGQKVNAKRFLEKNFIINKDYKLLLCQPAKQTTKTKGGHNREIIMLNIETFVRRNPITSNFKLDII